MHTVDTERLVNVGKMGWGVLIIPPGSFRKSMTTQEAFGVADLRTVFSSGILGDKIETHFDISPTIKSVRDSSVWYHAGSSPTVAQAEPALGLVLDNEGEETGKRVLKSFFQPCY